MTFLIAQWPWIVTGLLAHWIVGLMLCRPQKIETIRERAWRIAEAFVWSLSFVIFSIALLFLAIDKRLRDKRGKGR